MTKVTISDVARAAGVSKGAVSYVLNNKPGVSDETRRRVLEIAKSLGWNPNPHARALVNSRSLAVGVILARDPQIVSTDSFFNAFFAGVESVLSAHSHALVLQVVDSAEAEVEGYRRFAAERRVDGVILTDLKGDDHRIQVLSEIGMPAVTLNRPDVPSPFTAVCSDEERGVTALVGHLVQLGHSRIAHVTGPLSMSHSRTRLAAWQRAMAAHNLPTHLWVESDFSAAGGAEATSALLNRADRPTAIVFANDVMAISGTARARLLGLAIPQQLSVTGYDNSELSQYMHPTLTTVATNPFQFGQAAAQKILEVISGSDDGVDVQLSPPVIVTRESTVSPTSLPTPASAIQ